MTQDLQPPREPGKKLQISTILIGLLLLWIGCCGGAFTLLGFQSSPSIERVAIALDILGIVAFCALLITLIILGVLKLLKGKSD
ncbi:MAG: hypothetical protein ABSG69_12535 [Candidatus Acidiferrum sp.]|jgi:hypothetical protein